MHADFLKARTNVIRKCDNLVRLNSALGLCVELLNPACTVQYRRDMCPTKAGNGLLPWVEAQAATQKWALASAPMPGLRMVQMGQVKLTVIHPLRPSSERWWVLPSPSEP